MFRIKLIKNTFTQETNTKKMLCNFIKKTKKMSMGRQTQNFEKKFSKFHGKKFSVMVNSGSSANLCLLQALKNMKLISNQDKIACSGVTWSTNIMPIIQMNLKPVLIDIELDSLNISYKLLVKSYKENKFKVIFLTNLLGFSADIEKIKIFCKKKNIILLEDNCESLGTKLNNKYLGTFGLASTCSFFVGHHLSTIEGGIIMTDSKKLYEHLKIVRAHGWLRNTDQKMKKELEKKFKVNSFHSLYQFYYSAFNLRPTEINAFIGNEQLKYLKNNCKIREKNFNNFSKILNNSKKFYKIDTGNKYSLLSNFAFPIICKNKTIFNLILAILKKRKVEVRPIAGGDIFSQPFFKDYQNITKRHELKNSLKVKKFGIYISNDPNQNNQDIKYISKVLKEINSI